MSRQVRASGTYVFLPNIKDVGILRTRYPVYPVHGEGSSVWKELNALKEMYMNDMKHMKWNKKHFEKADNQEVELVMGDSNSPNTTQHTHSVFLSSTEASMVKGGREIVRLTSTANGHQHLLTIRYNSVKQHFWYSKCNGLPKQCWDQHSKVFKKVAMDEDATA